LNIVVLGSVHRTEVMGELLARAGYSVRSQDTASDLADEIIVQIGSVDDLTTGGGALDPRFPLLEMALCCWLVDSATIRSVLEMREMGLTRGATRWHSNLMQSAANERLFDSA
jgi:hypothetical protein